MSRSIMILSLVYMSSLSASPGFSGGPHGEKATSLSIAMEVAMEAVAACEKSGYRVTATVRRLRDNKGRRKGRSCAASYP